jgi:hypothetical protein
MPLPSSSSTSPPVHEPTGDRECNLVSLERVEEPVLG